MVEFIIDIGLSQKIHFSQELIEKTLGLCIELYETYNSSEFNKKFKYEKILIFLEKYIINNQNVPSSLLETCEGSLLPLINIWTRLAYMMLSNKERTAFLS